MTSFFETFAKVFLFWNFYFLTSFIYTHKNFQLHALFYDRFIKFYYIFQFMYLVPQIQQIKLQTSTDKTLLIKMSILQKNDHLTIK